jgi:hypothetical protein
MYWVNQLLPPAGCQCSDCQSFTQLTQLAPFFACFVGCGFKIQLTVPFWLSFVRLREIRCFERQPILFCKLLLEKSYLDSL